MAVNVYEFIGTRNARLAKFCDQHENVSAVLMKVVTHLDQMNREFGGTLKDRIIETTASPDGRLVLIKIKA